MRCMSTKFSVDSSNPFPFRMRTHIDQYKVADATDGHPTHGSATVSVGWIIITTTAFTVSSLWHIHCNNLHSSSDSVTCGCQPSSHQAYESICWLLLLLSTSTVSHYIVYSYTTTLISSSTLLNGAAHSQQPCGLVSVTLSAVQTVIKLASFGSSYFVLHAVIVCNLYK